MKPIYTLDLETDPFVRDMIPRPFCAGFYDGVTFHSTWGMKTCIEEMRAYLNTLEDGIIYIHNGGKFDVFYLMDWLQRKQDMVVINGRIVKGFMGKIDCVGESMCSHEIRDSYAIMPFPLSKYMKDEIDYKKMERKVRNKHKAEIISYLKGDCVYLHKLCTDFVDTFGDKLTIGSTAMGELKKLYEFECLEEQEDERIRKPYYYGGRVQCFDKGVIKANKGKRIKVYDINQSYPYAMKCFDHPISVPSMISNKESDMGPDTFFVGVRCTNRHALPCRVDDGITFDVPYGNFYVSIHEYRAALELGLIDVEEILEVVNFHSYGRFDLFVDKFHGLRKQAQENGDETHSLFYKYVGNSCYGKFSQDPTEYCDYQLSDACDDLSWKGYERDSMDMVTGTTLWRKPSMNCSRYNVATGASITGAARSVLMRGIANAERPLYCDTDCVICEELDGVPIDKHNLGSWKLEKTGTRLAIAGKKLYALFDGKECVKLASKGVRLSAQQIETVAKGGEVTFFKDSPTFNMFAGEASFLSRTVRMT